MKARHAEHLPRRHCRLLAEIGRRNHPGFKVCWAIALSGDGRGLDEALAPGTVSAIFTVEDGALGVLLRDPAVGAYLRNPVPVVVALESARDAAELHARVETGALVQ